MHHPDHKSYIGFTKRQRVDKAVHTLEGLLKGIAIDGRLHPKECKELANWCADNSELLGTHPFTELVPKVKVALADGVIDAEEQSDILWLCRNFTAGNSFYDQITADIQVLHGMLHGILADGDIDEAEAKALSDWIEENSHLRGTYPFDELDSLLTSVLRDGRVDAKEQLLLKDFFLDFTSYSLSRRIEAERDDTATKKMMKLPGVCAVCPEIQFPAHVFCFTGASIRASRRDIAEHVVKRRGLFKNNVCQELHYLVVGAAGNPCWAFSCYGRKVEQAVGLRRGGHKLLIIHENDFWDALADAPV